MINEKGIHVDPAKIEVIKKWEAPKTEEAFQLLKQKLCNAPILTLPGWTDDFVVYCAASNHGLGCVLLQKDKRWVELLNDYDCEIRYHPWKANVVADALKIRIETDEVLYYLDRMWVPDSHNLRELILNEAQKSRYSVHPGADKMYKDLKEFYWWPGMKKEIANYVGKCLTCSKVKAKYQKPSGFLQQPEIPQWKWEQISMDSVTKLPQTFSSYD
ncbi:hypothetical protein L1987_06931 [Smallanthus sonchifolius]|uniref:Uncharacterized protein n=1 Tax=Smallanthus sonchifolius TaxID=185202 RepID=A0ACB9JZL3_9ASTR|nr:hypothetical protein L1987_06931 [Smallanthus sonchifolius]